MDRLRAVSLLELLLVVLVINTSYGAPQSGDDNRKCVPGSTFKDDDGCNTCTCPRNGNRKEAWCTLMACGGDRNCVPGSTFLHDDGCNTCTCPRNGYRNHARCTLMACPPQIDDVDKCVPGSTFSIDCNTCRCPSNGIRSQAGCTLKQCNVHVPEYDAIFGQQ